MVQSGVKSSKHQFVWSSRCSELIPERFRRIVTIVLPIIYLLLIGFGISAAMFPISTFTVLIGTWYGVAWALLVAFFSLVSLIGLMFRFQIEIYSSIVLSILLAIYPFYLVYIVFHDPIHQDLSHFGIIFASIIYVVLPLWRVFDIIIEIRKSRQRQLNAECGVGDR